MSPQAILCLYIRSIADSKDRLAGKQTASRSVETTCDCGRRTESMGYARKHEEDFVLRAEGVGSLCFPWRGPREGPWSWGSVKDND